MVKPGGTGKPRLAISARLAPLPPSRSRMLARPSALPSPKVKTHLFDFAAACGFDLAAACAAGRTAAFAAGLVAFFFSVFRTGAAGAAFARAGTDRFDFAAIFLGLARALAMTCINPRRVKGNCAPYTNLSALVQAEGNRILNATCGATAAIRGRSGR